MISLQLLSSALCILSLQTSVEAFSTTTFRTNAGGGIQTTLFSTSSSSSEEERCNQENNQRRSILKKAISILPVLTSSTVLTTTAIPVPAYATKESAQDQSTKFAPKFVQTYEDFTQDPEGWQFKDVKVGSGDQTLATGDRAVFDWSGYTIGYFGRPFEAKGGPQGGAFDKDLDYSRTVIGSGSIVPGLEKALMSMKPGGVRQVIVPYGALSYPADDLEHTRVGPKPTTFSGQRALNFVLENPRVDRTLLFNVKLVRIDKSNGKGGFTRG